MGGTEAEAGVGERADRSGMNPLARAVLDACARAGVAEYVVCAGARNAAFALPLAEASESQRCPVRVWHFCEERCAAFFALGRSRALRRPVAVVTTSGTAVAELLPAVIEACYQGVPLVAITADRPKAYRGSGAPQAIEQPHIFGDYVGVMVDIDTPEDAGHCLDQWDPRRPAHVNVCLGEPLPTDCAWSHEDLQRLVPLSHAVPVESPSSAALLAFLDSVRDLVVMVGSIADEERQSLCAFLARLGAPVLAEAVSGLREARELRPHLLAGDDASVAGVPVGSVLRIGGVPVWRLWRDLEARPEVPVFSVTASGWSGLARPSEVVRGMEWDSLRPTRRPRAAPADHQDLETLLARYPRSECGLVRWLSLTIPESSHVFLGNSLPIREWNLAATLQPRGLQCHANRGVNGIDGILSTALGIAADARECWIVAGDLTTLYDLAAPWVLGQIRCRNVRFAVINNRGGRIFSRLPSLRCASESQQRMMENVHPTEFGHWASMWGMQYCRVEEPRLLSLSGSPAVVELIPDPRQTAAFWKEWGK